MQSFLKKARTIVRGYEGLVAAAAVMIVAGLVVLAPEHLMAQLPNFTTATGTVKSTFQPLVHFVRYAAAGAAALMSLKELKDAVMKNEVSKYGAFFGLLVVAGILAMPQTVINLLGMTQLTAGIQGMGIID